MARCREIEEADIDNVVDLLTQGFDRPRKYWTHALQILTDHPTPKGYPKYGFVIEDQSRLVGVVLLIFSELHLEGQSHIRCNVSSWYVDPAYRGYAGIFSSRAVRHKEVTYFNISPAPHTWPILEHQGFVPFSTGRTVSFPILSLAPSGAIVSLIDSTTIPGQDLSQGEIDVLNAHKDYGCLSVICELDGGRHPFVFGVDKRHLLMVAHLVFCRDLSEFVRFAGPVGRFLARKGLFVVKFNSNGPTRGIIGRRCEGKKKYRKGGDMIKPEDVAFSEQVMFGY